MAACRLGVLLAVPFVGVFASRSGQIDLDSSDDQILDEEDLTIAFSGSKTMCGGEDIWNMITQSQDLRSIMNINWKKIEAIAEDYIVDENNKVSVLKLEIQALEKRIQDKKRLESLGTTSKEVERKLIIDGLTGAFGKTGDEALATAKRTQCGVPSVQPRAPRHAYKHSVTNFEEAAKAVFRGDKRVGSDFDEVCRELLSYQENGKSYCGELCLQFTDAAMEASQSTTQSKGGLTSDELLAQQRKKKTLLEHHVNEVTACKQNKKQIDALGASLGSLADAAKIRFKAVRAANYALEDALWDLGKLEDQLAAQKKLAQSAMDAAKNAGDEYKDAADALAKVQNKHDEVAKKKKETSQALDQAQAALKADNAAKKAADELKMAVSLAMMKMYWYFDQEVQEPVRFTGLTEDLDLDEFFPGPTDPATVEAQKKTSQVVTSMSEICTKDAKSVFPKVSDAVDLSPLCSFGQPKDIAAEIEEAVTDRATKLVHRIEEVQKTLSPYQGAKAPTKEQLQQFLTAGEPKGYQEVKSLYHMTGYFKNYMVHWKAGGKFLALLAKLQEAIEVMSGTIAKASKELSHLTDDLNKLEDATKQAVDKLAEAAKKKHGATGHQKEMDDKVKALLSKMEQLKNTIAALEAKVKEAEKLYAEAQKKLMTTHATEIKGFEAEHEHKKDMAFMELAKKSSQASKHIAQLELGLLQSELEETMLRGQTNMVHGSQHIMKSINRASF